jgi:alcohol dehydrogenase
LEVRVSTATALVLEGPRTMVQRTFPIPAVGENDGILRVEACGLCGTDHEQYTGAMSAGFAFIPGHEIVGVIEEIGPAAAERWGVSRGDRVAVEVFQTCRACDECLAGDYIRCRRYGLKDMYGYVPVETKPALWGGYASHLYLSEDALVLPVPAALDPVTATLFNPLGAGIRWGVTLPGTKAGDVVAVLGPGIRGLSALVAAKAVGAEFVMVTGHGERDRPRLETATKLGADLVVDVSTTDPATALRAAAGRLADVVVHVAANAPTALGQATACAAQGATIVVGGMQGDAQGTPGFHPDTLVRKVLRIVGARGVDATAYREAIKLLAAGSPLAEVPRRTAGLPGVEDLIHLMSGAGDQAPPIHGVVTP